MTVISPLGDVGCDSLIRDDKGAACLCHLAHLAVEVFYRAGSVLAEHQTTDAGVRCGAAPIVILDIVLRMVRIVDTCQTVIVVGIGYHFSFLSHVRSLLSQHVAESVVSERGDSACRMVNLRAAVAHVVGGKGLVALGICNFYKSLDSVIFKCSLDCAVGSAVLNRFDCLATTIGIG